MQNGMGGPWGAGPMIGARAKAFVFGHRILMSFDHVGYISRNSVLLPFLCSFLRSFFLKTSEEIHRIPEV